MKSALTAVLLAAALTAPVFAQNVDLVTLPKRNTVQLTIYNSEDLTLAKETRAITLKKGANRIQFSWAGTLIDPTSVELRPLEHVNEIEVLDTILLGQKPQHLIWNIESEFEGEALVEVSYFTSGLTWRMDYVAISNPAENKIDFNGYVRVFNNSGEEYQNAEIRLIVGKINLIQKIAELAKASGENAAEMPIAETEKLKVRLARQYFSHAEAAASGEDDDGVAANAKAIVKEGVSEYFMFSIDGEETIPNGWSKRMPAVDSKDADFDIVYRMRAYQYGPRPVRFFTWKNDEEHQLGESPLPNGVIRVFRENGADGLSYLGQQSLEYVPITADIEVNLGPDDLVVFEQRKTGSRRTDFQFDRHNRVNGWNEHQVWSAKVRNYRTKPIALELRLQWPGDVEMTANDATTSFDFRTVETKLQAAARDSVDFPYSLTIRHGVNAKQNRVKLKDAE